MKKLLYSLVVVAFVSFLTSCTPGADKLILAKWTLETTEVQNLDEIVKKTIDTQMKTIDDSIKSVDNQLADKKIKPEAKSALEATKAQYEEIKKQMTPEKLNENIKKMFDELVGKATLEFKEDKSYESAFGQPAKGTYVMAADGKSMTTKDETGTEMNWVIETLSKEKFICIGEMKEGEMTIKVKFSFKK